MSRGCRLIRSENRAKPSPTPLFSVGLFVRRLSRAPVDFATRWTSTAVRVAFRSTWRTRATSRRWSSTWARVRCGPAGPWTTLRTPRYRPWSAFGPKKRSSAWRRTSASGTRPAPVSRPVPSTGPEPATMSKPSTVWKPDAATESAGAPSTPWTWRRCLCPAKVETAEKRRRQCFERVMFCYCIVTWSIPEKN